MSIPLFVSHNNSVSPNARLLFGDIRGLCNLQGYCWAGNQYFAEIYQVHPDTISGWITELKRAELIEVKINKRKGNKRKIFVRKTTRQKGRDLSVKSPIPIGDFVRSSLYSINKTINKTGTAIHFLISNFPVEFETEFLKDCEAGFKSQEQFDRFCNDFNDAVLEEGNAFHFGLIGKLRRYARNWQDLRLQRLVNSDVNINNLKFGYSE